MNIKRIIENYRSQMTAAGLLREAGQVQLSPRVAALRPSLTKINQALAENPDLLRRDVQASPFQILFEYTLPKLEVMLAELGEKKAERLVSLLCGYSKGMIRKHGMEKVRGRLEALFKELAGIEDIIRSKGIGKIIKAHHDLAFKEDPSGYLRLMLEGKISALYDRGDQTYALDFELAVQDSDLRHLQMARKVGCIKLGAARNITDQGLSNLSGLIDLEELFLNYTNIGDAGIAHIAGLPKLEHLDLDGTKITDQAIYLLRDAVRINFLQMSETAVTDKGLAELSGLRDLARLDVARTAVTDTGLLYLKNIASLRFLNIGGTNITENGFMELKVLPNLMQVSITSTRVSKRAIRELVRLIPNLQVLTEDGWIK